MLGSSELCHCQDGITVPIHHRNVSFVVSSNCCSFVLTYEFTVMTCRQQESIILEHVRKSHPNLREPLILDLDKLMPMFSEIRASWCKLRDHCCSPVDNIQRFWEQDSKFGSFLNATRWPHHVCNCLRLANRVVDAITKHQISVVLQGRFRSLFPFTYYFCLFKNKHFQENSPTLRRLFNKKKKMLRMCKELSF